MIDPFAMPKLAHEPVRRAFVAPAGIARDDNEEREVAILCAGERTAVWLRLYDRHGPKTRPWW